MRILNMFSKKDYERMFSAGLLACVGGIIFYYLKFMLVIFLIVAGLLTLFCAYKAFLDKSVPEHSGVKEFVGLVTGKK